MNLIILITVVASWLSTVSGIVYCQSDSDCTGNTCCRMQSFPQVLKDNGQNDPGFSIQSAGSFCDSTYNGACQGDYLSNCAGQPDLCLGTNPGNSAFCGTDADVLLFQTLMNNTLTCKSLQYFTSSPNNPMPARANSLVFGAIAILVYMVVLIL